MRSAQYDAHEMDTSHRTMRRANAKVNLALAVGPPRPAGDVKAGYHPIASWMASVDLADDVEVERGGASSRYEVVWASDAARPSPIDWAIEKDLAVRAHRALEVEVGRSLPVHLRVTKRIPVGGGLGGGSADAAAALLAVREVYGLSISTARLVEISAALGSDIAYFLDEERTPARAALVTSFGEVIERVETRPGPMVLVFPPFGCPTGPVYKSFDADAMNQDAGGFEARAARVRGLIKAASRGVIDTDDLFNDLAAPACRVAPGLRAIIDRLSGALNVRVHVTGSGSTLFALARSDAHAAELAGRASQVAPGVAAVATRLT